jgi:hypothetical protein
VALVIAIRNSAQFLRVPGVFSTLINLAENAERPTSNSQPLIKEPRANTATSNALLDSTFNAGR